MYPHTYPLLAPQPGGADVLRIRIMFLHSPKRPRDDCLANDFRLPRCLAQSKSNPNCQTRENLRASVASPPPFTVESVVHVRNASVIGPPSPDLRSHCVRRVRNTPCVAPRESLSGKAYIKQMCGAWCVAARRSVVTIGAEDVRIIRSTFEITDRAFCLHA